MRLLPKGLVFEGLWASPYEIMKAARCQSFQFLILGSILLAACRPGGDSSGDVGEVIRPVIYHEAGASGTALVRSFPARISATDLRELTFPRPGIVEVVLVEESDRVVAGQILARLDDRDYSGALDAARAQLENAVQTLQRAQRLLAEDAIARNVLEQREAAEKVARAEFEAAEKALTEATVIAPFDGVVSRVFARESQAVAAGTPAIRLFSMAQLEATIAVPGALILGADGANRTELRALVRLEGGLGPPIEAQFKSAELEADAGSQSYAVTFGFESPEGLNVLPGMNAEVALTLGRGDATGPVVPLRAIGAEGAVRYVWVVDQSAEPHRVSRRTIEVGKTCFRQTSLTERRKLRRNLPCQGRFSME